MFAKIQLILLHNKPFDLTAPQGQEFPESLTRDNDRGGIVAWMETDTLSVLKVGIEVQLDPVAVFEEFLLVCADKIDIIYKSERRY